MEASVGEGGRKTGKNGETATGSTRPLCQEHRPGDTTDSSGVAGTAGSWKQAGRVWSGGQSSSARTLKVSPWSMSPVWIPLRNQRTRCSELPWVNESGTT
jgi:hypothetical protein